MLNFQKICYGDLNTNMAKNPKPLHKLAKKLGISNYVINNPTWSSSQVIQKQQFEFFQYELNKYINE